MLGALLIYVLAGLVVLVPAVLFVLAFVSRKSYRCPKCGEEITTEYLDAQHCNTCGAPLQRKDY